MENRNTVFGLKAILRNGLTSSLFLKDILLPLVIAIAITSYQMFANKDLFASLCIVVELTLSIVPSIVGLTLAAYTIVNAFVLGTNAKQLKTDEGRIFLTQLNSSFAICLIISLTSLVISVICKLIVVCEINIKPMAADIVNAITLIGTITLLLYSILCLFWIVIDIFNLGQTKTLLNKEDSKEKK